MGSSLFFYSPYNLFMLNCVVSAPDFGAFGSCFMGFSRIFRSCDSYCAWELPDQAYRGFVSVQEVGTDPEWWFDRGSVYICVEACQFFFVWDVVFFYNTGEYAVIA